MPEASLHTCLGTVYIHIGIGIGTSLYYLSILHYNAFAIGS